MNKARFLVLGIAALGLTTVLHSTLAYAVVLEETTSETTSDSAPRHGIVTVKPSHTVAPGTGSTSSGIVVVPPPKAPTPAAPVAGPVTSGIITVPPPKASTSTATPAAAPVTSGIVTVPTKPSTAAPAAVSTAVNVSNDSAAAAATKAAANVPPPPSAPHTFKHGECPLTKDSSGTWRGPDGVAVDAATATMGDCKSHSK